MKSVSKKSIHGSEEKQFRSPEEWKAKFIVKEHNSQTGQTLDAKTVLSHTKSGMLQVNEPKNPKKDSMALRPDL